MKLCYRSTPGASPALESEERHRSSIGYAGWAPEGLRDAILGLGATLVDVRIAPTSKSLQWRKEALAALMGAGYLYLPALGNRNAFTGGPAALADPERAVAPIATLLTRGPVATSRSIETRSTALQSLFEQVAQLIEQECYDVTFLDEHWPTIKTTLAERYRATDGVEAREAVLGELLQSLGVSHAVLITPALAAYIAEQEAAPDALCPVITTYGSTVVARIRSCKVRTTTLADIAGLAMACRGCEHLILDLRVNDGGAGSVVVEIASLFLPPDTPVLRVRDRIGLTPAQPEVVTLFPEEENRDHRPEVEAMRQHHFLEYRTKPSAGEWWNIEVTLRHIGAADQLVAMLDGTAALSPLVFLMCHGDERGILLPELAPELEQTQPFTGAVGPVELRQFLRLPACVLVNTGCITGTPELAAAFLDGGASVYIGPDGYPDAPGSLFYCLALAYGHLVRGYALAEAHRRATAHDGETAQFQYFAHGSA